jgi:hypothetical protein
MVAYLWGGLALDSTIAVLAWISPGIWFNFFHHSLPQGEEVTLLRRAAGQWLAFAIAQALTLAFWRRHRLWLGIMAGIRFSDLFTDLFYVLSATNLTMRGWVVLLPLPLVNLAGVLLFLYCYRSDNAGPPRSGLD